MACLAREHSKVECSAVDGAISQYSAEVDALAQSLRERASRGADKNADGVRAHPTAYVERLTQAISLPAGCLFVGHTNTDLDSVGGAVGAAELYDGRATLAQPVP